MSKDENQGLPWWLSVTFGALVYCGLKYLLPALVPIPTTTTADQNLFTHIIGLAPSLAPVLTIPFLLLGAKQLYDGTANEDANSENQDF